MKKLFILTLVILIGCSTNEIDTNEELADFVSGDGFTEAPAEIIEPEPEYGTFNYKGSIPNTTNKIPTCKPMEPAFVHFDLTDATGNLWQRESPVTNIDEILTSEPDSLPVGNYTLTKTYLLSVQNDTLYALPDQTETEYHAFATTILPIDLTISEQNTTVEGLAMCYEPPLEIEEGTFAPGIDFLDLQTISIYVTAQYPDAEPGFEHCINWIHVWLDGELILERFTFEGYIKYNMLIPSDYDTLSIYAYNNDTFDVEPVKAFEFSGDNPYNPEDGPLVFDQCE